MLDKLFSIDMRKLNGHDHKEMVGAFRTRKDLLTTKNVFVNWLQPG
jgi:hypothetical protein